MGTALFGWDKTRDMKQNIQDCLVLLLPFRSMLCVGQWQYVFWRVSTFLISLRAFKIPFCDCAYLFSKLTGIEGGGGGEGNLSRLAGSYRERMVEIIPVSYLHPLITPLLTSLQIVTLKFLLKTIMNNRICN